jgi:hypothetical protein
MVLSRHSVMLSGRCCPVGIKGQARRLELVKPEAGRVVWRHIG